MSNDVDDKLRADATTPIDGLIDRVAQDEIGGWLVNRDVPEVPVTFTLKIGRHSFDLTADQSRLDVHQAGYPTNRAGFTFSFPEHLALERGDSAAFFHRDGTPMAIRNPGDKTTRSSIDLHVYSVSIFIDEIGFRSVRGWAYDEGDPSSSPSLNLFVDGEHIESFDSDEVREDVQASGRLSSRVGFERPIPARFYDDRVHVIEIRPKLAGVSGRATVSTRLVSTKIDSSVDGFAHGAIRGWVVRYDREGSKFVGRQSVIVLSRGHVVGQIVADQYRPDVAKSLKYDANCGFAFVPPADLVASRSVEFRFMIIPGQLELNNSPCVVRYPGLEYYAELRDFSASFERLFSEMWLLKRRLSSLLPAEQYSLNSYHSWALKYFEKLKGMVEQFRSGEVEPIEPLVSIICPTYRPRTADFERAVESVMHQTYRNWELIIVDDGSGSEELSTAIDRLARRDTRIKAIATDGNRGISAATNEGIAAASGVYTAFFDHDDLLVHEAVEIMIAAMRAKDAVLAYSDEDKIDDRGTYSEPNLKPDWNYRLLLAQNYVCHFTIVKTDVLRQTELLRSKYDGAQDHDLLLRLSMIVHPRDILHVPAILYHWRMTPSSTAAAGASKPYAVTAGTNVVADHLVSRGIAAKVTSFNQATIYKIDYKLDVKPSVTIIIPYREQIKMTRACVDALLAVTAYENYKVVLVDNWSTSDEALEFASTFANERVSFLRIEEEFNYSRLNNLAVASSSSDLLLFMNNDVIVHQAGWLSQMVGELLFAPEIAVVGNKLFYENQTVQHAGVILGIGGIADHAHRGLQMDDPGFCARAISAQEMSAVTAACMLCRRAVFDEVGGFDATDLKVAFNDIDFCLKVRTHGYKIVWTPDSSAEHRESLSRGSDFDPHHQTRFFTENEVMRTRWPTIISRDPHYNPLFSDNTGIFRDLRDPASIDATFFEVLLGQRASGTA